MILDIHTHVFPPAMIQERDRLAAREPAFAAIYGDSSARMANAEELLGSMEAAAIDASVALGFAWQDEGLVREQNDSLLESSRASGGRVIAFCGLPLAGSWEPVQREAERCLGAGARGFGELRPEDLTFDLSGEDGLRLGKWAAEKGAVLLFHASEPVGHDYGGKAGLSLGTLYSFIEKNPETKLIAAHWGGGLPFYSLMPEVRRALANVRFDSAATSLLYGPEVYSRVSELTGNESILFGSDFPLLEQKRSRQRIETEAGLSPEAIERVLGGNARAFLGLP